MQKSPNDDATSQTKKKEENICACRKRKRAESNSGVDDVPCVAACNVVMPGDVFTSDEEMERTAAAAERAFRTFTTASEVEYHTLSFVAVAHAAAGDDELCAAATKAQVLMQARRLECFEVLLDNYVNSQIELMLSPGEAGHRLREAAMRDVDDTVSDPPQEPPTAD